MRIPEFLGAPFQAGIERAQRQHVGRIGGIGDRLLVLPSRAITSCIDRMAAIRPTIASLVKQLPTAYDTRRHLVNLVAELGPAFLCADGEITPEVCEDHAAYIDHWLKTLQDDKRLIFSAAAQAQRVVDYRRSLQMKQIERERAAA